MMVLKILVQFSILDGNGQELSAEGSIEVL